MESGPDPGRLKDAVYDLNANPGADVGRTGARLAALRDTVTDPEGLAWLVLWRPEASSAQPSGAPLAGRAPTGSENALTELWAKAVETHIGRLRASDWGLLDVKYRTSIRPYDSVWPGGKTHRADRIQQNLDSTAAHQLRALDPSGWIRGEAVAELRGAPARAALGPLTVRLTDWVPAVRRAALDAFEECAAAADPSELVEFLPLIDTALRGSRVDRDRVERALARCWTSPLGAAVLWDAAKSDDGGLRHASVERILRRGADGPDPGDLARLALNPHGDARWRALEAARALPSSPSRTALIARFLDDASPAVRVRALRELLETGLGDADLAARFVLDRSARVRRVARFHAAKRDPAFDATSVYRGHAERSSPKLCVALSGLAETGTSADVPLVCGLLDDRRPEVAGRAMDALVALDPEGAAPRVVHLVDHPRAGVRIHALRCLAALGAEIETRWVERELDLVRGTTALLSRAWLVRLLPAAQRLRLILSLHESGEHGVQRELRVLAHRLHRHFGRGAPPARPEFAPPGSASTRRRLHDQVRALAPRQWGNVSFADPILVWLA